MQSATWKSITAIACLMALVLVPATSSAQEQASIQGLVTDETGGALPGVTVTVASEALIEQQRVAITDGSGGYNVIALPPGVYSVSAALPGFNTVQRDDVVLQGAFTASIDLELPVGELSETVTVTSAAPLVDIVSTRQQSTLTAERVNVLPGAAGINSAAAYVPGTIQGSQGGEQGRLSSLHGSDAEDSLQAMDGVRTGGQLQGRNGWGAGVGGAVTNEAIVTEVVFDTSSQSAEYAQSGIRTNVIPKAGGNNFNFDVFAAGTNSSFATDNLSDELKDMGFQFAPTIYSWNINPAAGGPIVRNKLWFYTSAYERRSESFVLDRFFDLDEPSTPDGVTADDLRVFNPSRGGQQTLRVTHQVSQRNKLTYNYMRQTAGSDRNIVATFGEVGAEAAYWFHGNPTYLVNGRWTSPVTSRLLLEADVAYQRADVHTGPMDHGGELRHQITNQATGGVSHSSFQNHHNQDHHRRANASLSYVTGSHNFKAGLNYSNNYTHLQYTAPGEIFAAYNFNGWPLGLLVTGNGDNPAIVNMNCDCGVYAQDAWTMDRLTVNGGIRFDWFNGSVPGGERAAGYFAPAVTIPDPTVEDIPNWKDTTVRFGVAYDLFGDGSTAVKASGGKYVENMGTGVTSAFNPINSYAMDWRSWSDLNGDGVVMDTDGTPQFDEIGPSYNPNFGTGTVSTQYDPNSPRGTNWEWSGGVERQLGPGWALSGMWHYRKYGDYRWTENLNISKDDYYFNTTFTGPGGDGSDLPESAQYRQVDIYNVVDGMDIITGNDRMQGAPLNWRSWNGFEVILDGELPRGGFMTASFTGGASKNSFCQSGEDNPNNLINCYTSSPFRPMGKLSGALPLPYDTMISGLFQVLPGNTIDASYVINQTDIPSLNLGGNSTDPSITYNLIEPNTEFEDYRTQLNLRFSKVITVGDVRTRVYMDATNLFNQARVTRRNQTWGGGGVKNPSFLRVLGIEPGRRLTFGLQSSF